jgi:hypothetical protein
MSFELIDSLVNAFAVEHKMRLVERIKQGNFYSATFAAKLGDRRTLQLTDVKECTSEQVTELLAKLVEVA